MNAPYCGSSCCKLADLTQRGALLPHDPCKRQLDATHPRTWRAVERRFGQGRRQEERQGLEEISHPVQTCFAVARSQPETLSLPCEMQLHSFQLSPAASAARQARELGSSARKGFPALLSPAFPSGAGVSSKSQQLRKGSRRAGYHGSGRCSDPSPRPCPIPWDNTHVPAVWQSPKEPTQCYNKVQLPWL